MSNVSKEIAIELVEDGQAGNGIVSVTRTYGISASGTTASDTTSPSDITTWSAGSPTVTTAKPYLWVKEVTVYTETSDTTKYYCVGKRGDNGIDAKDVEWAYIRTTTPTAPTILNDNTYTDSNSKTYTADGHLPRVDSTNRTDIEKENSGSSSKYYECTDDPKGVNDTWKYEWEIKRTKGNVGADGSTRTWNYYTGDMTLHNNYAESAYIIDIDNDNDQFGTDSDSKVLVEQTRSTTVTLYDGATPQTLKSLTVALKYENGTTNVPTSVATYTADKDTGKVDVTVKVNNTSNSHTEIQAHITATDTNDRQKTIVFALYKVMGGAPGLTPIIYNVAATDKVFSFQRTDANALTPSSRTSQINVARTEGNTTTILDTAQSGLTFSWGFDDESTAQATSQSIGDSIEVTNTQATSHSSVWVELSTGDRETLAIVKDGAKGNSGTSVEAQYAPNSSPTSSQIHTTFQNGDKYMRTRSGSGSWSGWQKIVGENGAETDFTFNISKNKTSTSASTAPANCYYSEWQDAPIAVTTTYPYLWAKVVQKDGDGTIQSTSYIRLTGEDGKSVLAQYSVDGSSNWHTTFATGDEWMRTSDNGGTSWSSAMKIVGEDGNTTNFEFGISQYQTANGAPSDISTWSDAPIATTSSKPYLWSKVTTPDGTVSYIRLTGEKGASITKSSEVNTYKVSDSGTTTPTGTWYSTKAAANNAYAWSANRYMWTKTVITWSDTSTTTLYSAERNPDDGGAGMSIVIASQSVTYSKQTSGNLDPTTLTYGSYPSSLSKGDWLYSKTTVNYETSEGASAGSTSTYSVSYIGTDGVGQAGRGITGVYEHYKASANSTGETTPTSTDWGTTPTPSDWGKDKPYLWNYERITYSSGTTVERTTASVVAVWTEDGAGIDSITNYYLATSASSGVTTSTSGWTTSVQTMDETNCYLWNYERISYTQGKSSTTTTPHIIGHYGRDGEGIASANVWYALNQSSTTAPSDSSFTYDNFPTTLNSGYYVWEATKVTYTDGSSEFTGKMCLGATSEFLTGTEVYAASASNSTTPTSWSTTYTKTKGYYLWAATRVQYTNGTYAYLNPKCVGYWGEDGTSPWIADFDNEMDSVACDSSQKPIAQQVITTNVNLYYGVSKKQFYITSIKRNGGTSGSYGTGVTVTPSTSSSTYYTDATITVTYATTATISNKDIFEITLKSKDDGTTTRVLNLTVNGIVGDARYNLVPSDNIVSKATNGTYSPSTITCSYTKYDVAKRAFVSSPTGGTIKYTKDGGSTEYPYTIGTTTLTAGGSGNTGFTQSVTFLLYVNQVVVDKETIQIVEDGISGTSPIIADIDNEMDAVPVDKLGYIPQVSTTEGGVTYAAKLQTTAKLWEGSSHKSFTLKVYNESGSTEYTNNGSYSGGIKVVYTSDSQTSNTITFYFQAGASIGDKKVFRIVLNSTYIVYFTVKGINGDIYQLLPNTNEVVFGVDGTTNEWTPTTGIDVYCGYTRNVGGTITEYVGTNRANTCKSNASYTEGGTTKYGTAPYNIFFRYQNADSSWGSWSWNKDKTNGTINIPNSTTYVAIQFILTSATGTGSVTEGKILDRETIQIIKSGKKGDNSIRLAIDNEHEDFIYSESGKVAPSGDAESQARLYDGAEQVSASSVGWAFSFDGSAYNGVSPDYIEDALGVAKISSSGLLSVKEIGSDSVSIKVRARYPNNNSGNYYYAEFTANKTQQDKYDIIVTPNAIAYNPSSYSTQTLNISATVTNLQGEQSAATIDTSPTITTGLRVWYAWVNANGSIGSLTSLNATSLPVESGDCNSHAGVYFELRLYRGGSLPYLVKDHETVEFAKSQNGISPTIYMLDSSVSYITIPSDSSSATLSATVTAYQKEGTASKTTYSGAYLYLFTRTSSSVTVVDSSNSKRSSITISSRSVQRTLVSVGVVMLSSFKAASGVVKDINNGAYMAIVEIPVLANGNTGGSGENAIHLDLDNENDAIQYMGGTNLTVSVTSQARLYGATETISIDRSRSTIGEDYCSISNSGLITVYDVMNSNDQNILSGIVVVKATVNQVDYFATFTVQRLDNGQPKYWLKIDTPAVVGNISNDTASVTVNVQVWRTAINTTTNMLEDTQVSSLSTYNRKLWRQTNSGTPSNATASYVNGVYAHTIDLKTISDSTLSYTYYVTNSISSWSSTDKIIYDKETVPVTKVQNGQQGIQGKMGRTPYYWGKWSEKTSTDTFTVNDYMTPYVANGETGGIPQCWIFIGANGSYTKSTAGEPSNTSQNWQLMTSDFEYLITKAIFSDFAQLGSGIFNGDFVFSQEGTIDGWEANTTKAFVNPYTCYYPTSSSIKGRDSVSIKNSLVQVNTTTWTAVSDSFTALKGVPYVISFYFASNPRNYYFKVASAQPSSSDTGWWSSQWNYARPYNWVTEDSLVKVWCRKQDSSKSSVQINDIRLTTFVPNLAWNWKTGEIYSQLGHFVNVTVEGVINNLIQEITSTNYTNKLYRFDGSKAWLDVLSCGSVIRFASDFFTGNFSSGYDLYLPCACRASDVDTSATIQGIHSESLGHTNYTLDDVRQCVGKKLYIINQKKATSINFHCLAAGASMLVLREHGWDTLDSLTEGSSYIYYNDHYSGVTRLYGGQYARDSSSGNGFFLLECKMGRFNNAECIYWEITASPWTLDNLSNS